MIPSEFPPELDWWNQVGTPEELVIAMIGVFIRRVERLSGRDFSDMSDDEIRDHIDWKNMGPGDIPIWIAAARRALSPLDGLRSKIEGPSVK